MENREFAPHTPRQPYPSSSARPRCAVRGVTMPELMVVIGIIVVLMAILVPALRAVRMQTLTSSSMNNLRQVAAWMGVYERDNREIILPSRFDYSSDAFTFKGHVRRAVDGVQPQSGEWHKGSWADILWTINEVGVFPEAVNAVPPGGGKAIGHDYRYVAPDRTLYDVTGNTIPNPFRAALANSRNFGLNDMWVPKPHGVAHNRNGAYEQGYPGLFAANNFFDAWPDAEPYDGEDPPETGRWWSTGQIRSPDRSMYIVDSFAGEVIDPEDGPFNNLVDGSGKAPIEVDFRYSGSTLMLMLDGNIRLVGPWALDPGENALEVLEERGIRIRQLDKRVPEN